MISVRAFFSFWAFTIGFALQPVEAAGIWIADGGQLREFEVESGIFASAASTNGSEVFLFQAKKPRTALNRRRLTSDILVELRAGADPISVRNAVSVEGLRE